MESVFRCQWPDPILLICHKTYYKVSGIFFTPKYVLCSSLLCVGCQPLLVQYLKKVNLRCIWNIDLTLPFSKPQQTFLEPVWYCHVYFMIFSTSWKKCLEERVWIHQILFLIRSTILQPVWSFQALLLVGCWWKTHQKAWVIVRTYIFHQLISDLGKLSSDLKFILKLLCPCTWHFYGYSFHHTDD